MFRTVVQPNERYEIDKNPEKSMEMTFEEKRQLIYDIIDLPTDKLGRH